MKGVNNEIFNDDNVAFSIRKVPMFLNNIPQKIELPFDKDNLKIKEHGCKVNNSHRIFFKNEKLLP